MRVSVDMVKYPAILQSLIQPHCVLQQSCLSSAHKKPPKTAVTFIIIPACTLPLFRMI